MRNSVSLSVYFPLVLSCDVKQLLFEKEKSASGKMKLIPLMVILIYLAEARAQKFRQEQFPFPPQFQTPNAGMFSSDSSLYLPPESHTPIPYFPINKVNGLQYPLLPPTGTKAPVIYPPHFPLMISTTLVPNFDDDDEEENTGRIRFSSSPQPVLQRFNQTEKKPEQPREQREMRPVPRMVFQQTIQNRNDVKFPFKPQVPAPPSVTVPSSNNQLKSTNHQQATNPPPAARRMIITTETQKSDLGIDQARAASFQGPQFLPAGPGLYVSSTTEPAIPILRLSNEMDLDGSFSYEALGADQTHYVQHSRMENMGPDKVEQVVEGSYSYVGDNGQTYTVHYIADANGFRASGDHLPVAPAVPEIIQRAVQYNLAEEAKKPPHLRDNGNWQDNESWKNNLKDNEISDNSKNQQFSLPPPRNLFTGRTPEAFSYSYSQGSNTGNNLITAASTQNPIKTVEFTTEQPKPKPNNGPISPQITFLASQGAHVPSLNTVQDTISRMFTTEKSTMPQLVNYEAGLKEAEQDPNKGLWRWQYGYNANNLNPNPNKETISRSSGEGDDVMINFGDMTPEQYTKIIHSQFEYTPEDHAVNQHTRDVQNYDQLTRQSQNQQKPHTNLHYHGEDDYHTKNKHTAQSSTVMHTYLENDQQNPHTNVHYNSEDDYYTKSKHIAQSSTVLPTPSENDVQKQSNLHYNGEYDYYTKNKYITAQLSTFTPTALQNNVQNQQKPHTNLHHHGDYDYFTKNKHIAQSSTVTTIPLEKDVQNQQNHQTNLHYHDDYDYSTKFENKAQSPTVTLTPFPKTENWYQNRQDNEEKPSQSTVSSLIESRKLISDTKKILTHKDFIYPSQTVTQSYNFDEDTYYEPRKIKAINTESVIKTATNKVNTHNEFQKTNDVTENSWIQTESEFKESTTLEPHISSSSNFKFTDFIFQEDKGDFKPITTSTSTETASLPETTTQNIVEDILGNNIFLKNLFKPEDSETSASIKNEVKTDNKIVEEPQKILHIKIEAEPKADKITKLVQYHTKPKNEVKNFRKKPMDISDIINYVSMKNHFESGKMKPKSLLSGEYEHRNQVHFIPIQHENEKESIPAQKPNFKQNVEHQEELRGIIKNYKVLQRNSNVNKYDNNTLKRELSPPPLKSSHLPPLGRAGPAMKSYLPPIFV